MTARQTGMTLIEIMLSLALGMGLVLAAASLFVAQKGLHAAYAEAALMEENARQAIGLLRQAIRQAAYLEWDTMPAPEAAALAVLSPDISGLESQGQTASAGLERSGTEAVNGSDVLALRFSGSGLDGVADGSMADCSGRAIAALVDLETDRGWSVFYIGRGSSGEPELRCKFRVAGGWTSQPVVAGVESLQILYGLDADEDGLPNHYLNAGMLDNIDAAAGLAAAGSGDAKALAYRNRNTRWKKVVSIRLAMVVRAFSGADAAKDLSPIFLFGESYALAHGIDDPGATLDPATLPEPEQRRARKLFVVTILLHNRSTAG